MSNDKIRINETQYAQIVAEIVSGGETLTDLEEEKEAPDAVKKNATVPLYEQTYDYSRQAVVETHHEIDKITSTMTTIKSSILAVDDEAEDSGSRIYSGNTVNMPE